ncbi:hypothetical protein MRX96_013515 [Rhipicephalus microplus]
MDDTPTRVETMDCRCYPEPRACQRSRCIRRHNSDVGARRHHAADKMRGSPALRRTAPRCQGTLACPTAAVSDAVSTSATAHHVISESYCDIDNDALLRRSL